MLAVVGDPFAAISVAQEKSGIESANVNGRGRNLCDTQEEEIEMQ
jgi:hypothetical protein